jgi:hypothetical protein
MHKKQLLGFQGKGPIARFDTSEKGTRRMHILDGCAAETHMSRGSYVFEGELHERIWARLLGGMRHSRISVGFETLPTWSLIRHVADVNQERSQTHLMQEIRRELLGRPSQAHERLGALVTLEPKMRCFHSLGIPFRPFPIRRGCPDLERTLPGWHASLKPRGLSAGLTLSLGQSQGV